MLMDNPRDWRLRIDSLQTAVIETMELMTEVLDDHVDTIVQLFAAEDQPGVEDNPFAAVQDMLIGQLPGLTPGEFLAIPASERPAAIPEELRAFNRRDFYQLMKETLQLIYCLDLLIALGSFGGEGFDFFMNGYYENRQLPVAKNSPPRSVMRTLVNQVSFDLSVIQHAINQRRRLQEGQATLQGWAIAMADQLSRMAMGLAMDAGYLPENTKIITYLARSVRARLVPYADTVLISVAYASIQNGAHPSRDFLAIPHEIGHHLFWNGWHPESNMSLRARILEEATKVGIGPGDWRLRWLEEIFADTYALLLAGPVIVLDFQDMLDDDMSSHFREDTDKHPIPEIRPFIQTEILRKILDENEEIVYAHECDRLDDNWRSWLKSSPLSQRYSVLDAPGEMTGQEILDAVAPLLAVILDTFDEILPTEREYEGMAGSNDVMKLFQEFQSYIMPTDDLELVNHFLDGEGTEDELENLLASNSEVTFAKHIKTITGKEPDKINTAEWLELLRCHGWSSEGPMGDGGGTTTGGGTPPNGSGGKT